jgi:hypothetical protein
MHRLITMISSKIKITLILYIWIERWPLNGLGGISFKETGQRRWSYIIILHIGSIL